MKKTSFVPEKRNNDLPVLAAMSCSGWSQQPLSQAPFNPHGLPAMMATSTASAEEQSKKRTREDDEATDESTKRSKNADGDAGPASKSASKPTKDGEATINDDEAALYDRQIRLWGLDGQTRCLFTRERTTGRIGSFGNETF